MTTGIQLLRPSSLFSGAPYAYAAQAPPGSRFVFLAGACPLDSTGTTVGAGSHVAQAQAALDNMELALAAAAASITDVIFTRVLVATIDRDDLRNVWGVVAERFGDHRPARSAIQSLDFGRKGEDARFMIEVAAYRG